MQIFSCPNCAAALYFHNTGCACGAEVTFDPESQTMQVGGTPCQNRADIGCNWVAESNGWCRSCAMTDVVPDLRTPGSLPLWEKSELAKRWVLANLGRWGWFSSADTGARPQFRLLSEETAQGSEAVVMGHADGVITINVTEARGAVRAERQEELGELYRTMQGHVRHEMAHFLFLRLSQDPAFQPAFRELFGDERADYGAALEAHYNAPRDPGQSYITQYATAHPHEDWAETIAHLLHLVDLLDSAAAAQLALPEGPPPGYDAYGEADTESLLTMAVDLSMAVNHVNRALDLPDVYPFILQPAVREKMDFAHRHLRTAIPTP